MNQRQIQKIQEIQDYFEEINAIEQPVSGIMQLIQSGVDARKAIKLKIETSRKIAYAMGKEAMDKWVDEVVRPVVTKFLPAYGIQVSEHGQLIISGGYGSYQSWMVSPVLHADRSEGYEGTKFVGFSYGSCLTNIDPSELQLLNDKLADWVISTAQI